MIQARVPKSNYEFKIDVVGRDGAKQGSFRLSSGNIFYYRKNCQEDKPTGSWTYQQLIQVLELQNEIATEADQPIRLPLQQKFNDLTIMVQDRTGNFYEEGSHLINSGFKLSALANSCFTGGTYQIDLNTGGRRPAFGFCFQIGIRAALWIVDVYIRTVLSSRRSGTKNVDVPVSKIDLQQYLRRWLKQLS